MGHLAIITVWILGLLRTKHQYALLLREVNLSSAVCFIIKCAEKRLLDQFQSLVQGAQKAFLKWNGLTTIKSVHHARSMVMIVVVRALNIDVKTLGKIIIQSAMNIISAVHV